MKNHRASLGVFVLSSTFLAVAPAAFAQTGAEALAATKPFVDGPFNVEVLATGLEVPWDIAFLPDGRALVTERPGRVRIFNKGRLDPKPALTLDDCWKQPAENGLMGMCPHPDFAKNHYVYLAYGHKGEDRDIRVVRYVEQAGVLEEPVVILKDLPAGGNHAGCRVRFGPDGKLYVTAGEMFKKELAQDLKSLGGKILRLNDDGTIPADNPFNNDDGKKAGARPEIWSFGNRNPQGIDWNAEGVLVETEHGPSGEAGSGGDEINIIEKGKNYGWPTIHHDEAKAGLISPLRQWTPAIAPASGVFYKGEMFPQWKGQYLFGALGGLGAEKRPGLYRIELKDGKIAAEEHYLTKLGRIRFVTVAPDGSIWVTTSNRDSRGKQAAGDDRILRLTPKK